MVINLLLMAAWGSAIYLSRKLFRDVFTPLSVYVSIWFACMLLFRMRFVDYYELETRTTVLIGASILAFVLGCIIARHGKRSPEEGYDLSRVLQQTQLELAIKTLLVLNLVGALIFAYRMNSAYGLATYITDPAVIRRDWQEWTHTGLLGLLLMLDYPLLACSWIHYLLTKKWRWFSTLGLLLVCAQTYLRTDRGTLTIYVITCISLWVYWNRWSALNWRIVRRLGTIAALLLAYFLAVGLLYGKLVSKQTDVFDERNFSVTSEAGLALLNPYIYATGAFPALQEAMADVHQLSWGTHSFFPVARILYGLGILREKPEGFSFDFYRVPIPFNTYTHLFAFYQDFGVPGMILLPLLLGFVETRLYLQMKARPSLFSLGMSSGFMALNVFSVFIPLVTSLWFWYYFVVLYAVSRFCQLQEPALKSEGALGHSGALEIVVQD